MTGIRFSIALALALTCGGTETVMAQVWEQFDDGSAARWDYVADGVMGGVSQGRAVREDGAVRLTGEVSTANNGGFIQVRRRFEGGFPEGARGLRLSVRGNGETYYVFLRASGAARVWHSYRASFVAGSDWMDVTLDFADFAPSHAGLAATISPGEVVSVGLVAYGRDFDADMSAREIALY